MIFKFKRMLSILSIVNRVNHVNYFFALVRTFQLILFKLTVICIYVEIDGEKGHF